MIPPIIKIVLSGEPAVGKSSIVLRITRGEFKEHYIRTINVRTHTFEYGFNNRSLLIGLRDPEGHRIILDKIRSYMRNTHVALLLFDISRPHTMYELGFWLTMLLSSSGKRPVVLIGNKKDLRNEIDYYVTPEEGKAFAEHLGEILGYEVPYLEVSAKTGENVDKIIPTALSQLIKFLNLRQQRGSVFP